MRLRLSLLVLLTGAACSGDSTTLEYGFEPGLTLTYEVHLDQQLTLATEGDSAAVASEDLPGSADVHLIGTGTFNYTFSEGPSDDTLTLAIDGSFDDVTAEGTANGEPVDDVSDIEGLGAVSPVSRTLVVDRRGAVVADSGAERADPTAALGAPLAGIAGDFGQLVGPVLSPDAVAVGDTWSETSSEAALGEVAVESTVTATLVGQEPVNGVDTLRIDTESETTAGEVDLSGFFADFFLAFAGSDGTAPATLPPDVQEMVDQLVFLIRLDPSTATGTSWFDPERGHVVKATTSGGNALSMEVALPDETTGELQSFDMSLSTTQTLTYTLIDG